MSKPIRVALLGYEDDPERGLAVAKSLNAKIVGVVGNSLDSLDSSQRLAEHLRVPNFDSYHELLEQVEVKVLVASLPEEKTKEVIAYALESKKVKVVCVDQPRKGS